MNSKSDFTYQKNSISIDSYHISSLYLFINVLQASSFPIRNRPQAAPASDMHSAFRQ